MNEPPPDSARECPRYFFRKENRVLKRSDFQAAYAAGRIFRRRCVHVFVARREDPSLPTRIGLTATRKTGGSVQRNRVKRMGREIFRHALPRLRPGYTIIVNLLRPAVDADYRTLRGQFHSAWHEARLFVDDPDDDAKTPAQNSRPVD